MCLCGLARERPSNYRSLIMEIWCPLTVKLSPRSTATIAALEVGATARLLPHMGWSLTNRNGSKGVSKVGLEGLDPSWLSRFTLRYENKEYVLDEQIPTIDDDSTQEEIEAHQKHYDDENKMSCIMASSMSPELQKTFKNT
ncbi:hypothetical protein Tco_0987963 [Tanacetum coccineum]|uniref:Uncharacterized protein n=1 Tax=Tanacetum coccineum TaxID=301880 RepID=A0ABQ5EPM8_9ASTR